MIPILDIPLKKVEVVVKEESKSEDPPLHDVFKISDWDGLCMNDLTVNKTKV